ncbi:PLP-dependent aminotransferase family protein [Paraburkholderia sp. BCC1884]|uniref:aminotransferase-like domain-containing protein n=1 Tax=Paraburkholderia sp. BCC1884 TaxID=2562668 RepID=UPI0021B41C7A|nr:PLP-dependent aminotransferase family protein [Paraburkholderia sp. BCC1884]
MNTVWTPRVEKCDKPIYQCIADALAADIASGKLNRGDLLPPQRTLARLLGVDFTTVTRAYKEARQRGLIEARVGQGTFVRFQRNTAPTPSVDALINMMVNSPPSLVEADSDGHVRNRLTQSKVPFDADTFMRYQPPAGTSRHRDAGAVWLAQRIKDVAADRLLVCPGTQGALLVVMTLLAGKDDVICVEALTYPGFILLARHLGIRLIPVEMDEHGATPQSLANVCEQHRPKAFYCMPTLHNPTALSMPLKRRQAIASVLRKFQIPLIEDDNYWPLFPDAVDAPAPLSTLVPELAFYLTGLSKSLTPAMRIAYMVTPDRLAAERAAVVLRATASMASPLNAELATRWIEDGTATAILTTIRREVAERQSLTQHALSGLLQATDTCAFHVWLRLPAQWTRAAFAEQLRASGISVALSDAFSVGPVPEAVRLSLGGPETRLDLAHCLERIAMLLKTGSSASSVIV